MSQTALKPAPRVGVDHLATGQDIPALLSARWVRWMLLGVVVACGLFIAFYNLTNWPLTWFDEGSHLHVPKALVQQGVYADVSSEGLRHYGPTIGVGPTVMLPLAGAFTLFGIGLQQARLVMAGYLIACVVTFFFLVRQLAGVRAAWVASLLLVVTPAVGMAEYGRQVLGEVPGLFFVSAGLLLWFARWERARWWELVGVGLLLGLGIVTKYQILLVLGGALGLAWLLNFVTFRAPQRLFLIPGIVTVLIFGAWQTVTLVYLGPSTLGENLAAFQAAAAGAAAVFNPDLMARSVRELLRPGAYLFLLLPVLAYSGWQLVAGKADSPFRRDKATRQHLSILYIIVVVNLAWYIVGSVSWIRYAFLGLAFAAIFVALCLAQLTGNFDLGRIFSAPRNQVRTWIMAAAWLVLAALIVLPGGRLLWQIASAPVDDAPLMAQYMNENVDKAALVETWEPQMGFFTEHLYHYPPQVLLNRAVRQVWLNEAPVNTQYDFTALDPEYVLVGEFSRWVDIFPQSTLDASYQLVHSDGQYQLYRQLR